jgi:hypothetical protein
MLFKRISALGVVLVLLFLAGCQKEDANTGTAVESESATTMPISYYTLPVPEDGWSGEELITTFHLYGHQFSKDFTIESLGEDFEIDRENSKVYDGGACSVVLKYNKKSIDFFSINYKDIKSLDEVYNKKSEGLNINVYQSQELYGKEILVFNGIKLGATKEEIETAFGKQTGGDGNSMFYFNKDRPDKNCLGFWLDDNEQLFAFSIVLIKT